MRHMMRHIRLTAFISRTTWVSRHQKGRPFWILLKQEMMGGSGISWTICKSIAPHSRHITMPVPHHSIFYGPDALPDAQPTVSKHWRKNYAWWEWSLILQSCYSGTHQSPSAYSQFMPRTPQLKTYFSHSNVTVLQIIERTIVHQFNYTEHK